MRKAFTILEMMVVISVLAILMTIVTISASNAIRSSRAKRRDAMRAALQAAIATYQASNSQGEWPGALQAVADAGRTVVLTEEQAQNVFRVIVQKSAGESGSPLPLIDPHGLYVAPSGAKDGVTTGMTYDEARRGKEFSRRKFPVSNLLFGYQGPNSGKFRRFNIVYHAETDSVTVHVCCDRCLEQNLQNHGTACDPSGGTCTCQYCHGGEG